MLKTLLLTVLSLVAGGCASYSIQKDGTGDGYDVYRPEPYILVTYPTGTGPFETSAPLPPATVQPPAPPLPPVGEHPNPPRPTVDANGGATPDPKPDDKAATPSPSAQIIWLPNYHERYRVSTSNFLAKADFVFEIKDGWQLTEISDKSDNTAAVTGLMDIAKSLVGLASPATVAKAAKTATTSNTGGGGAEPDRRTFDLYKIVFDKTGRVVALARMPWGAYPLPSDLKKLHPPSAPN